ncbi:MAG: DNA topoisomerase (ATP-hydrolyzing) [Lachnospiraceae bacterium]|nr:DNA topoisomerase (ATP-hydrolyzing) [Lachnospiraceae bacterium]
MQKSFIDYSMSVITARALPDARDGLKPVQRRVLYAMDQLGLNYDKPHRKSARIVGDTMGKYHPHGDSSIYETLVVLEQDFKKGMALVDGHGNFGSIEGDGAAAMRYTEAKLKKFTQDVYLKDLDKNVVDFIPNFDETEKEPEVLPVRVPNLLINGAEGIAVGMTTNIPTHNLAEVCDAVCAYMDNENITTEGLMQYVIGPDFPTGGLVVNKKDLLSIYESGTGKIKLRGKVEFEPGAKRTDKDKLVITEIPYTMIGANISKFISDVVDLIETKKTSDIVDISNESSKEGIRIVLELKKNADVEKLKNLLYKKTKLEDTFGVNMLAIVDNRPETLGLKAIIKHHVDFQYDIATRKYTTLLNKERENKEIKEGLIRACNIIDLIIEILRGSKNLKQAKECLINGDVSDIKFKSEASRKAAMKLDFTPRQATAVLELRLYKLIGLEIEALQKEYEETLNKIAEYEDVLNNRSTMKKVIKKDIQKIKKEYQVPRKTIIEDGKEAVYEEVKLVEQEVVFIMDRFGYAKTVDNNTFERNKEAIFNENKYVFKCMNTEKICIFTDKGDLHQVKVADIPFGRFRDKGTPIDNLGNYDSRGENIIYLCSTGQIIERKLLFATKMGMIKLVDGKEFDVTKRTVAATKLNDGDEVINVLPTDAVVSVDSQGQEIISSEEHLVIKTEGGYYLKFAISEIPQKKKGAVGVRGIKLVSGDSVSDLYLFNKESEIVVGYGKKQISLKDDINLTKRDGRGVKK